jgi:RNA polymerase-binding transcription factor DksA
LYKSRQSAELSRGTFWAAFNCVTEYTDLVLEGNQTVQVDKLVMRRSIVGLLVERLNASYDLDLEFPDGNQAIDRISNQEIDALLSFRSDPKLDELRTALTRFDNGTFGICIGCKNRIDWSLLLCDPGRRICPNCEDEFRNPVPDASVSAYPNLESNFAALESLRDALDP